VIFHLSKFNMEIMIIEDIKAFDGQHCETTATGTLLQHLNINLSEPMLFGLGEGLGFIFWNQKTMDFPFIGGRIKPDLLSRNLAKNLKLELIVKETNSPRQAWEQVKGLVDKGLPVGLKLDCYHLEYFSKPFHFAAHYVALYGYDNDFAYLVDTSQQGGKVKTSLKSLELARAGKGSMSSKNLYYTIYQMDEPVDLKSAILSAIRNDANDFLNPPITNIAYKGILKTSQEIIKWFKRSENIEYEFRTAAMLMEKAGTGGALFRNLFRDFLGEAYELLKFEDLKLAQNEFGTIARLWNSVSELFEMTAGTKDIRYIHEASAIMKDISDREKKAMEMLMNI
jgi:hypothetical protein